MHHPRPGGAHLSEQILGWLDSGRQDLELRLAIMPGNLRGVGPSGETTPPWLEFKKTGPARPREPASGGASGQDLERFRRALARNEEPPQSTGPHHRRSGDALPTAGDLRPSVAAW